MGDPSNPAALVHNDPAWADEAARHLRVVRDCLRGLSGAETAVYDHIGSTAVPGLAAKPFLDLQVRILPLPTDEVLVARLGPLGFVRAVGSRPESPGVNRDEPRGSTRVADEVWQKSLLVDTDAGVILHVRRSDSPWGSYTVAFRDWLRSDAAARSRYERCKRQLSEANAGNVDYDDYTRAKTEFFDDAQDAIERWVTG